MEKALKALWVKNNEFNVPPKIHNLAKLAQEANYNPSEKEKLFLLEVNDFNVEARYPDSNHSFYAKCTREFAEGYLSQMKEFYECILKKL